MQVQGTVRAKARTGVTNRSGTLDNGNPWSVFEVEVIDSDDNKAVLRCEQTLTGQIEAGKVYDLTCDFQTKGNAKALVRRVEIAK